jgi:hypothetical protein
LRRGCGRSSAVPSKHCCGDFAHLRDAGRSSTTISARGYCLTVRQVGRPR